MSESDKTNEFLRLLMANQKRFYAFILALVPNHTDAEDLFQETVLVMWSKFDSFSRGSSFVAWGITIAKYQILNACKRYSSVSLVFSDAALDLLQRDSDPNTIRVDFWVLVDGRVRFSRTLAVVPLQSQRIDIPLGPNDRFLTLATSNPREYLYCWAMFAEPQLELTAKTKTLEGNTRQ